MCFQSPECRRPSSSAVSECGRGPIIKKRITIGRVNIVTGFGGNGRLEDLHKSLDELPVTAGFAWEDRRGLAARWRLSPPPLTWVSTSTGCGRSCARTLSSPSLQARGTPTALPSRSDAAAGAQHAPERRRRSSLRLPRPGRAGRPLARDTAAQSRQSASVACDASCSVVASSYLPRPSRAGPSLRCACTGSSGTVVLHAAAC